MSAYRGRLSWMVGAGTVGLTLLGGCIDVDRFDARDLEMFNPGRLEFDRDYRRLEANELVTADAQFRDEAQVRLVPNEKVKCRWPDHAEATMNGLPAEVWDVGSGPAAGCLGTRFNVGTEVGAVDSVDDVPPELTGDAEFIVSDETTTIVTSSFFVVGQGDGSLLLQRKSGEAA